MIGTNDFIAGVLHPVTALEDALPIFMLGVLAGQNGLRRCEFIFWLLPIAMALGAIVALMHPGMPGINLVNIISMVALGLSVAIAKKLPIAILVGLALLFGLSHGYANGVEVNGQIRPAFFISGVALAALFLVAYGTALTDFLLRRDNTWMPIAVRVAGSWSAAIGLLVLSVSHQSALLS
jgi:urease accessory protein